MANPLIIPDQEVRIKPRGGTWAPPRGISLRINDFYKAYFTSSCSTSHARWASFTAWP